MRKIFLQLLVLFISLPIFSQGLEATTQKRDQIYIDNFNAAVRSDSEKNTVYYGNKTFEFNSAKEFSKNFFKFKRTNIVICLPKNSAIKADIRNIIKGFPIMWGQAYEEDIDKYFNSYSETYLDRIKCAEKIVLGFKYYNGDHEYDVGFVLDAVYGLMSETEYKDYEYKLSTQLYFEKVNNEKMGYGRVTNAELEKILEQERINNKTAGKGQFTNKEISDQIAANEVAGLGAFCDTELETQRKNNEAAGKGYKTDFELKKDDVLAENSALIAKAEEFEAKNQLCYALGVLYDAMRREAERGVSAVGTEKYNELAGIIESGLPGRGSYNVFQLHDSWKTLLIDAEKYGTEYGRFKFIIGKLQQGNLNYSTRTATYSSSLKIEESERYKNVISIISEGYKKAYKEDWTDLSMPRNWPNEDSVSGYQKAANLVNGVAVYRSNLERNLTDEEKVVLIELASFGNDISLLKKTGVYNAFAYTQASGRKFKVSTSSYGWYENILYDLKFNIVDNDGNEIIKPKRYLPIISFGTDSYKKEWENKVEFEGIPQSVIEKIDNGNAHINLVGVYLKYGQYSEADDVVTTPGINRAFVKNFQELEIPLEKIEYEIQNN